MLIKAIKNSTFQAVIGLLGFAVGIAGIYLAIYYSKSTNITYQMISDGYVIEIKEKLSKLNVLYDGKSLKENNQSLRMITFKVSNTGENTIRLGDYDEKMPLGFSINHGEILEPPKIAGSKSHFSERVNPRLTSKTSVVFSPLILEPGDYYTVTALVLVTDLLPVKVRPEGVIAGLPQGVPVFLDVENIEQQPPAYVEAVSGRWSVQLIRIGAYTIVFWLALILLFALLSSPISYWYFKEDKGIRAERIGIVNEYISKNKLEYTPIREYIFFRVYGSNYFQ